MSPSVCYNCAGMRADLPGVKGSRERACNMTGNITAHGYLGDQHAWLHEKPDGTAHHDDLPYVACSASQRVYNYAC